MQVPFPFGFPLATGFYLVFYVFTLAIHVVFMNYVLAGTAYLAADEVRRRLGGAGGPRSALAEVLRDWLPFMLSGAITAGVAPLLFVQILYKQPFYTANLLLFHRWMSILPVLIAGFYLLYLLKSPRVNTGSAVVRGFVALLAFASIAYTGIAWTENHLLALRDASFKAQFYASGSMRYHEASLWPRLLMWAFGAMPTMAAVGAWQLWYARRRGAAVNESEPRRAAILALAGLVLAPLCGLWYFATVEASVRKAMYGMMALPYLVLAVGGLALQIVMWLGHLRANRFYTRPLALASLGSVLTIVGMSVVREAIRVGQMDMAALAPLHEKALKVGGLPVFLAFFVLNALACAWCFVVVRKGRSTAAA